MGIQTHYTWRHMWRFITGQRERSSPYLGMSSGCHSSQWAPSSARTYETLCSVWPAGAASQIIYLGMWEMLKLIKVWMITCQTCQTGIFPHRGYQGHDDRSVISITAVRMTLLSAYFLFFFQQHGLTCKPLQHNLQVILGSDSRVRLCVSPTHTSLRNWLISSLFTESIHDTL